MLKINQFYWTLYKESEDGKKTIAMFEECLNSNAQGYTIVNIQKLFNPEDLLNETEDELESIYNYFLDNLKVRVRKIPASDLNKKIYSEWGKRLLQYYDFQSFISAIVPISFYLYTLCPDYFIPYFFHLRYKYLQQIIEDYDLPVDQVPGKASMEKRSDFYFSLCDAFYEFRKLNLLTPAEMCAFLFDMQRRSYDSAYPSEATPFPRVWLISGSKKTEKEANDKVLFWQANKDTKKGDILIFKENGDTWYKENRASITGIWTALTDGITDPLFYYYEMTCIGKEIKVKPIPFKVLSSDERTKGLPRLGAHFLGVHGDPVSTVVYEGLLELIEERDPTFDRSLLPTLHEPYRAKVRFEDRGDIKPEKWVEEYLIKEMLEQMGWGRNEIDYRRQVPLQMGREKEDGETVQRGKTDFSLFPHGPKMKHADVLIEAKAPGEMDGKDIEKTFWQAKSYASRQYATLIILADGDKVILYPRKKDGVFSFSNTAESFSWTAIMEDKDTFNKLRDIILKHRRHGRG